VFTAQGGLQVTLYACVLEVEAPAIFTEVFGGLYQSHQTYSRMVTKIGLRQLHCKIVSNLLVTVACNAKQFIDTHSFVIQSTIKHNSRPRPLLSVKLFL
jgi:hypothetical protein